MAASNPSNLFGRGNIQPLRAMSLPSSNSRHGFVMPSIRASRPSSSTVSPNPTVWSSRLEVLGQLSKLEHLKENFFGCNPLEYGELYVFGESGLHPFIVLPTTALSSPMMVPDFGDINNSVFIRKKADGSGFERCADVELKQFGVELSLSNVVALAHNWGVYNDLKGKIISNAKFETADDAVTMNGVQPGDSIEVISETGVKWTVMGGLNLLYTHFGGTNLSLLLNLHNNVSEMKSSLTHGQGTMSVWEASNGLPPNTFGNSGGLPYAMALTELNNERYNSFAIGMPRGDPFKENNLVFAVKSPGKMPNWPSRFIDSVVEILCTAGKNVDTQIGVGITSVFGIGAPTLVDHSKRMTPYDYVKLGFYGLSCLLIFCSWMFKPTPNINSVKERRLKTLSYSTAGAATYFAVAGVFYNIFSVLPLEYAICLISACVGAVIGATCYNCFSK